MTMLPSRRRRALLGLATAWPLARAGAAEVAGLPLDDTALVAGQRLKLNGAGISYRYVFKVYAAALYLAERRISAQDILNADEPRRLQITALRDISHEEFAEAITSLASSDDEAPRARSRRQLVPLFQGIARPPHGLRRGDTLVLDWVPGQGTLVELNRKPVPVASREPGFYQAVLDIWLGERPADPDLKNKLLGRPAPARAALNPT